MKNYYSILFTLKRKCSYTALLKCTHNNPCKSSKVSLNLMKNIKIVLSMSACMNINHHRNFIIWSNNVNLCKFVNVNVYKP